MKTSSLVVIVVCLVLAASLLAIWFYPSIKDFMDSNVTWNGLKDFSEQNNLVQLDSLDTLSEKSGNDVLISIPYTDYTPEDLSRLKQYLEDGNTVLLMDDFGYGNTLLGYLGIDARFDHNLLLDPLFCYKNAYFPRITDFSPEVRTAGIEVILFNHATVLNHVPDSQVIARSSPESFLDLNHSGSRSSNEPAGPFPVAARINLGRGTLELVSDPSIIINSMDEQNDNRKFISFLASPDGLPHEYLLDRSHLTKSPLDIFKIGWNYARGILANPYITLCLLVAVFFIATRYTLRKGDLFG